MLCFMLLGASALLFDSGPVHADCSCVVYVQNKTGLPASNDATGYLQYASSYTERVMNLLGWHRIVPQNNGYIPAAGGVMMMDAGAKGADPVAGHMAYVVSDPTYDYGTQLWTIHGMGHYWSGGSAASASRRYSDPRGPSAAEGSWAFFSHWRLAGRTSSCSQH